MRVVNPIYMQERLLELELALEQKDWVRMGYDHDTEFSRDGVRKITELARLNYIKNPLIKRGVNIQTFYVFGRGVNISAKDETINEAIQAFIDDENNQNELTSPQARKERDKELRIDGNLFFALFVHPSTGNVRIGTIPFDEITEVLRNPDNRKQTFYYRREWNASTFNEVSGQYEVSRKILYYRDFRYAPTNRTKIGDHDIDQTCVIYHVKVGGFQDWAFGISEVYAAIDWARAYKSFLEDFAKIIKSLARFAWRKKVGGGAPAVAAARRKLNSTFAQNTGIVDTNPSPNAGAVMIESGEDELSPLKTANATTSAEQGKELRMMSGIAMGLPDHIASGDTAQGTLATAKSLDRPTEFQFTDRQELWVGIYQTILTFVIYNAVVAPNGPLRGYGDIEINEYGESIVTFPDEVIRTIDVDFPSIIEHDIEQLIRAIISAATFDGKTPSVIPDVKLLAKMVLSALGVDDVDEIVNELYPAESEIDPLEDSRNRDPLTDALEQVTEALRELKEVTV